MKRLRENEIPYSLDLGISLMLPSQPLATNPHDNSSQHEGFECKTCNRKFSSFQALGGHRANHKRPKLDVEEEQERANLVRLGNNKPRMHQCSICGQEFTLGQALGGHMRKHRAAMNDNENEIESFPSINEVVAKVFVLKRSNSTRIMCMDLNLTPLENDLKLLFGNKAPHVNLPLC